MSEPEAADVILSDGTVIKFDKRKIKRKEWKALFDPTQPDSEANEIVGRFSGTSAEYIAELSVHDWQLLMRTAHEVVRRPVDPNLPGESISPSSTKNPST
jgi:hypothetical protein